MFPKATLTLAAVLAVVFAFQSVMPGITDAFLLDSTQAGREPWTLVTSMFLHGSLLHLGSNLFSLFIFGLVAESLIGTRRFILVYVASGLVASVASLFFYDASLGASGAIFGIIGFLAIVRPRLIVPAFGVPLPILAAAALWIVLSFAGLFSPGEIAYAAHLGGMAAGAAIGGIVRKEYREERAHRRRPVSDKEINEWEEQYMKE